MSQPFNAANGEDRYLWELFGGKRDGLYVDVGAGNGVAGSVSYAFDSHGWLGVCIEPHPQLYLECIRHRPRSRVLHVAVAGKGSWSIGNFAIVIGNDDASFLASNALALERAKRDGKRLAQIPVPIASLDDLLVAHTSDVDWINVDVNGSESDVLDGLDVARYRPTAMLVADYSEGSDPRVEDSMERVGYRKIGRIGYKDVYAAR